MTNDEARMSNQARMTNEEPPDRRYWSLVIGHWLVIVVSSFVIGCGCALAERTVAPGSGDAVVPLTVATYNVRGARDIALILKNLREINADVVFLQEIRDTQTRLKLFARALGMRYVFASYGSDKRFGCAILARGTLKHDRILSMAGERNHGLAARLKIKNVDLYVICVHLKSLPRPLIKGALASMGPRARQADAVVKLARKYGGPVIVAGDCNALPFFPEYLTLSTAMIDSCAVTKTTTQPTIFVGKAGYRIDHVFVKGDWRVVSCNAPAVRGSDHRPVVATLRLRLSRPPATGPAKRGPAATK